MELCELDEIPIITPLIRLFKMKKDKFSEIYVD